MKKKIVWLVVSCLMVAALLLAACGPAAVEEEEEVVAPGEEEEVVTEEEVVVTEEKEMVRDSLGRLVEKPRRGGVFNYAASTSIQGFDEARTPSYMTVSMAFTNDELITGDWTKGPTGTGEVSWLAVQFLPEAETGGVAESWEILDDRTVRFNIRKGIHFALNPDSEASRLVGGRELNAHDVVYSLKRHYLTPGAYMQIAHTPAEREGWDVWAEDDWTVIHQWNPELARVIFEFSDFCRIIAEEVIEEYGDMKEWEQSHGTGPFILIDYVDASSATFVRNPDYWRKQPLYPEDTMPYLDGIKYLIIPDLSTRLSAMRTGKIDYISLDWEDAASLMQTNPELKYFGYPSGPASISMRMDNPELPWYDKRVRHALSLAVDQQVILDTYYGGHGMLLAAPVIPWPEFMSMYTPLEEQSEIVQELFGYDPEKAKQLLAEAGYPDGFSAKVVTYSSYVDLVSIVKAYWEEIGVNLEIDVRDYTVWTGMTSRKKQEEMVAPGTSGVVSNPGKFSNYYSVGYLNYSLINDPVLNKAIEEMDALGWEYTTKYQAILKEVFPYILEETWSVVMPGYYTYKFWQPWVKDYNGEGSIGYLNSVNWLNYIWLDQDLKYEMTGGR